jgi:hypothetical protein
VFEFASQLLETSVAVERRTGRPVEIRDRGERLAVTALEAVRDETAAYALESGPRRVFVVRAQERRYRLIHLLSKGRWSVEELATPRTGSFRAA